MPCGQSQKFPECSGCWGPAGCLPPEPLASSNLAWSRQNRECTGSQYRGHRGSSSASILLVPKVKEARAIGLATCYLKAGRTELLEDEEVTNSTAGHTYEAKQAGIRLGH